MSTLAEIQEILYLPEKYRTPQKVLRLSNICHQHFLQCRDFFKKDLVALTRRKLFGKYSHNLTIHSPISYRNFSGSSLNVENEERTFNTLKSITSNTSSHHHGHLLGNLIIRIQAEEKFKNGNNREKYNEIEKYGKLIATRRNNTIYTFDYIKSNSEEWQALLETRLADFLMCGPGVWWRENEFGIEFNDNVDLPLVPYSPKLHHFRSSSYKMEEMYLSKCWRNIMEQNIRIPIDILRIEDEITGRIDLKKLGMIENLKHLNSIYNFNEDEFEVDEDFNKEDNEEELVDFVEEAVTANDDDKNHVINNEHISLENVTDTPVRSKIIDNEKLNENDQNTYKDNEKMSNILPMFVTKEARNIAIALGKTANNHSDKLITLDNAKTNLRENPMDKEKFSNYMNSLAPLQTIVLKHVSDVEKKISMWENEFCLQNNLAVPIKEDWKDEIKNLMEQLKYGKFLLKTAWNIKL